MIHTVQVTRKIKTRLIIEGKPWMPETGYGVGRLYQKDFKEPGKDVLLPDNVWREEESVILIHSILMLILGNGIAIVTKICGLAIYRSGYLTEIEKTIPFVNF
jgi:hypothetical protein